MRIYLQFTALTLLAVALVAGRFNFASAQDAPEQSVSSADAAFNIPSGKDAAFYRDAVQKAINAYQQAASAAQSSDEALAAFYKLSDAVWVAYDSLADSQDPAAGQIRALAAQLRFTALMRQKKYDDALAFAAEIQKVADKELSVVGKKFGFSAKLNKIAETSDLGALRAFAEDFVKSAMTDDDVATDAENLLNAIAVVNDTIGAEYRGKLIEAFKNSDSDLRKKVAESIGAETRFNEFIARLKSSTDADAITKVADDFVAAASSNEGIARFTSYFIYYVADANVAVARATRAKLYDALKNADSASLKQVAADLENELKFDKLIGEEMKVEGLYLDGSEINWAEYRGKVVLVDFWATWCPPCVAEVPNVLELYKKYHDAGFEVLGYSLDSDLAALEKFEKERNLPWKTASRKVSLDAKKKEGGKEYVDLSEFYPVESIPRMILVDKDGKIIETQARGNTLRAMLEKIFPDVK